MTQDSRENEQKLRAFEPHFSGRALNVLSRVMVGVFLGRQLAESGVIPARAESLSSNNKTITFPQFDAAKNMFSFPGDPDKIHPEQGTNSEQPIAPKVAKTEVPTNPEQQTEQKKFTFELTAAEFQFFASTSPNLDGEQGFAIQFPDVDEDFPQITTNGNLQSRLAELSGNRQDLESQGVTGYVLYAFFQAVPNAENGTTAFYATAGLLPTPEQASESKPAFFDMATKLGIPLREVLTVDKEKKQTIAEVRYSDENLKRYLSEQVTKLYSGADLKKNLTLIENAGFVGLSVIVNNDGSKIPASVVFPDQQTEVLLYVPPAANVSQIPVMATDEPMPQQVSFVEPDSVGSGLDNARYESDALYRAAYDLIPAEIKDEVKAGKVSYSDKLIGWTRTVQKDGKDTVQVWRPNNGDSKDINVGWVDPQFSMFDPVSNIEVGWEINAGIMSTKPDSLHFGALIEDKGADEGLQAWAAALVDKKNFPPGTKIFVQIIPYDPWYLKNAAEVMAVDGPGITSSALKTQQLAPGVYFLRIYQHASESLSKREFARAVSSTFVIGLSMIEDDRFQQPHLRSGEIIDLWLSPADKKRRDHHGDLMTAMYSHSPTKALFSVS